jgi:hypothetical protein
MKQRIVHAGIGLLGTLCLATASHSQQVPRTSAGVPDFSGLYASVAPTKIPDPFAKGDLAMLSLPSRDNTLFAFEADFAVRERGELEKPQYRPEYWQKVREADLNGNKQDPVFTCMPAGPFRMGPPQKIVQTPTEIFFLYPSQYPGSGSVFRAIAIDGRPANEFLANEQSYMGYSRGHWQGDRLVIETVGFNGKVWLGWPGYITTADLRVVEELWWENGKLKWQPTAFDSALLEPYKAHAQTLTPNPKADADMLVDGPCDERDLQIYENIGSTIRG